MFLYILNILNDGMKKNKSVCERSSFQIINDTNYISHLAGIKRSFDIKIITDKIMDIFDVLISYNLTRQDIVGIFHKLIGNKHYSWILEYFYNSENNIKEQLESMLNSIIINIVENIYARRAAECLGKAV
ncbi:hypothetical protein [Clostridium sp. C2-6-12]|uniref:hypothetical protein n=1 Tax=Clostridium sp. C2-6-12 TaxID=2698832 RepID=UPI00136A734D|nr:hypothetical protein [Clostridium sp. C2-6-12]